MEINFNVCASVHQNVLKLKNIFVWAFILLLEMDTILPRWMATYRLRWSNLVVQAIIPHWYSDVICVYFILKFIPYSFPFFFPFNDDKTGISMGFLSFRAVHSPNKNQQIFIYVWEYVWKKKHRHLCIHHNKNNNNRSTHKILFILQQQQQKIHYTHDRSICMVWKLYYMKKYKRNVY